MNLIELSKLLQKSPMVISAGIQQGVFPFAAGTRLSGNKTKIIFFEGKLQEYVTGASQKYDLSTKSVAQMLGVTELTVQVFLRDGLFPFGCAYKTRPENAKYTYVIYPGKLEEFLISRQQAA